MALQFFAIVALLSAALVGGQPSGPVLEQPVLTGPEARELALIESPALLELAARSLTRVFIDIAAADQTVLLEEGVNANLDCYNWLINFPGGSTEWLFEGRDRDGVLRGNILRLGTGMQGRRNIGGQFNRWLNITSTIIAEDAEVPDQGDYTCEVCIARGTAFEMCHNATTTVVLVGAPPVLQKGDDVVPIRVGTTGQINIGSNLCINRSEPMQLFQLLCSILTVDLENGIRSPIPESTRTWITDPNDVVIYNTTVSVTPVFNDDFFMDNRMLFMPGVFMVVNLDISSGGLLDFNTVVMDNLTNANILPDLPRRDAAFVRELVFDEILGEYMCRVENIFGFDEATTIISECGEPAFVPGCPSPVINADGNGETPVGCTICIARGAAPTLDCTAVGDDVMYLWTNEFGQVLSTQAMLTVNREGQFTCNATNPDNVAGSARTTVVRFRPDTRFSGTISGSFGVRSDSGCSRLNPPLQDEPDLCVFVGENILLTCTDGAGTALVITDSNGNPVVNITASPDGSVRELTFQCAHNDDSECGTVPAMMNVIVYDPARIDRTSDIGSDIGAGRSTSVQLVTTDSSVTLQCPISGIGDPIGSWSFFRRNADGGFTEVVLSDDDPDIDLTNTSTLVTLTINNYNGSIHNGIYSCQASNRAGADSAIVSLSNIPDTGVWEQLPPGRCNINCRDGVRVASVVCRSQRDGRILPNTMCVADDRPASVFSCADLFPDRCFLTPIFVTGNFGPCSEDCRGGFRKRDVSCVVPMTGEVRPMPDCRWTDQREPPDTEFCPNICCKEDDYDVCKRIGSSLCNLNLFQQRCCWTCLLRVRP